MYTCTVYRYYTVYSAYTLHSPAESLSYLIRQIKKKVWWINKSGPVIKFSRYRNLE